MYGLACALALIVSAPAQAAQPRTQNLCGPVLPGFMHCDAAVVKGRRATAHASTLGSIPYGPADIQDAYGLTSIAASYGADQTVAIVDAYDLPTAESDLGVYRSHYGLPPCTTASGCFRKVNQAGIAGSYPAYNSGWAGEIALDLEAVSATCPQCHILLVEANTASVSDLAAAVNRAAAMGATQISNSYGGDEWNDSPSSTELLFEDSYNHPGIAVTVSSGDSGYGVEYPAASQYVTAVGGTSLHKDSSARGWSESAWSGAGSGCSLYIPKPTWQTDSPCLNRAVADVSAVADPNTGLHVYRNGSWYQVGGTSLASPVVAAAYALTGSSASAGGFAYAHSSWFNDVTSGSNGSCPITSSYLCNALSGFDGPTGMGTPASAHPTGPPPPADVSGTGTATSGTGSGSGATTSPTPPVSAQPAQLRSSVSVAGATSRPTRNGRLRVKLVCGGGPACSGVLSLQIRLRGTTLRAFGRSRYNLATGKSAWVVVRLSSYKLRLLEQRHRVRVYGTALDADGTSAQSSFMLRAPRPKPRKRAG
jgi:subtilase family serine protease